MFIEPTLLDIEKQWESNRDNFAITVWKDTGMTTAEWAWLKHPSFWSLGQRQTPPRPDNQSWWDWSASHLTGHNLQLNLKILKYIQAPIALSSLTNVLIAAAKIKLGFSKDEAFEIVDYLSNKDSLSWSDHNSITAWDAALATRELIILNSLLATSRKNGINPIEIVQPKTGNNLLHIAVQHDWENGVRTLVENGLSLDQPNKDGLTPKDYAKELENKNALKGFNIKKDKTLTASSSVARAPKQQNQMDLF